MRLMRDLVDETLSNRYRLLARVAGGGMSEVYRGHDLLLDRTVAVKILQPSLAADPELVARFRAEARAAARLTHPNIVGVYDWGAEDDETYYMVMEYIAGTDLRDLLTGNGVLEAAHGAEIVAAVCDALQAAHSVGLVHRDVKPENILIARDGKVKVADFGIAVVADVDRTTPGGAIPGTLRYLSPEQARGLEATAASDVWAAGAVLAEALTGRPPLLGSGGDLLRRRATEVPVPPSTVDPSIPSEIDEVVLRACALEPADRYPSAGYMAADLRRVAVRSLDDARSLGSLLDDLTGEIHLPDMEPTTITRPRRRRLRARIAAVLALLVVLAGLGVGGALLAADFLGPREVHLPSLVGMKLARAERRAARLGLLLEVSDRRKHSPAPRGQVIGQVPEGVTVEEGTTVTVFVSAGLPSHKVPAVVGLSLEDAEARLESRALRVGEVSRRYSRDHLEGIVMDQSPLGGRLEWGSEVLVVVSKGPKPVEVPNVVGVKRDRAIATLEDARFVVEIVEVNSQKIDAGLVIATDPKAGVTAPEGSTISVTVSLGPELRRFRMPDVRGMTVSAARAKLAGLGLDVRVVRSCPGNRVVETDPVAGDRVTEGDRAALFVC